MKKLSMNELNRPSTDEYRTLPKAPVLIVLDDVRSAYNVGSVFRTADAFRVSGIRLCGITARPPHKDILKTSLGATDSVSWEYVPDVETSMKQLKENGYAIYAVEQVDTSISLADFIPPQGKQLALVFGHEVNGVSEKALSYADGCIEIPQFGTKHSFNIAVSAGIVLWEVYRKLAIHF